MNNFSIKDVENLCGIKAHTLRIWEKRYGLLSPKRKDGNHRVYDNNDLKHLLSLSFLYHKGLKISSIASLPSHDLNKQVIRIAAIENNVDLFVTRLVESAISFDIDTFGQVFDQCTSELGMEETMLRVIYPYLERIGLLWMTDHTIPAQERLTSSLICRKLLYAIDNLQSTNRRSRKSVLLFSPEGEYHEIPILFAQFLYKKYGHQVVNIGTNCSISDLESYVQARGATHLHFHLITSFLNCDLKKYVSAITQKFPELVIVFSGPKSKDVECTATNLRLLKSLQAFVDCCRE